VAVRNMDENNMETLVIDRRSLPDSISFYIESERVEVSRKRASVVLSPVKKTPEDIERGRREMEKAVWQLHEMFSDGRMTSEDFIRDKAIEKALEEN